MFVSEWHFYTIYIIIGKQHNDTRHGRNSGSVQVCNSEKVMSTKDSSRTDRSEEQTPEKHRKIQIKKVRARLIQAIFIMKTEINEPEMSFFCGRNKTKSIKMAQMLYLYPDAKKEKQTLTFQEQQQV